MLAVLLITLACSAGCLLAIYNDCANEASDGQDNDSGL